MNKTGLLITVIFLYDIFEISGRGAARLARYSGGVEVVGSNPVAPTIFLREFEILAAGL